MIEPIKPCGRKPEQTFLVADIENRSDGSVLAIGTSYRLGGIVRHLRHEGWEQWFPWIMSKAESDKRYRTIHAHNGGGWDWLSLVEWLLANREYRNYVIEGQRVQGKIVVLRIGITRKNEAKNKGKRKAYSVKFVDSLYLLRSGLDKLAESFLGKGKLKTDGMLPEQLYVKDRAKFDAYLKRDCEALLLILEKTYDLLYDNVAKIDSLGVTIGSTAMKVWRTGFLSREVTIPKDEKFKAFLREGYTGGRVEVFQHGLHERINVYDVNSLYPSVMLNIDVPMSDRTTAVSRFRKDKSGIYRIRFAQSNQKIPAVFMQNGTGIYEGEGVYFSPEIALFREVDTKGSLEIVEGFIFDDVGSLFSSYVDTLFTLRQKHKGTAIDLLCKYLLNSLYGKFGQKSEREQYSFMDYDEAMKLVKKGERIRDINLELGTWLQTTDSDCEHEHVGIAGMITSAARVILYRGLLAAGSGLVYCDTDSVHSTTTLPKRMIDELRLGNFKHEFTGRGCYAGRKLYALQNSHGKEKVRAKGVSVGGRNGFALDFDSLVRIVQGEQIRCRFFRPATATEIMRGEKACVFRERKRTLRMVTK